eukprot:UN04381
MELVYIVAFGASISLGHLLWQKASEKIPTVHQRIIFSIDNFWAFFIGVLIFNERVPFTSVLGALLISGANIVTAVEEPESKSAEEMVSLQPTSKPRATQPRKAFKT